MAIWSAKRIHLCKFGGGYYEEHSCVNLTLGLVVREEMALKGISYLQVWPPVCSAEQNHLCNLSKGHYEKYFREIILKFAPVVQGMLFKDISYFCSDVRFVRLGGTICAVYGRGHNGEQNLFQILTSGSGDVVKE